MVEVGEEVVVGRHLKKYREGKKRQANFGSQEATRAETLGSRIGLPYLIAFACFLYRLFLFLQRTLLGKNPPDKVYS